MARNEESCITCRWKDHHCDKLQTLLGAECPEYEKKPNKNQFTCFKCPDNKTCDCAWDEYNLKGDCLAIK